VNLPNVPGAAGLLLALVATAGAAQVGTGRVLLATVVDARASAIVDLGVDDFVVTEGGQTRDVLDVHVADYPIALILDDGGDEPTGEAIRAAARRFILRIGERPLVIGAFSSAAEVRGSFDQSRDDVLAVLESMPLHSAPRTPLIGVVARAATVIRATESPFAAIVVIGATPPQTGDAASGTELPFIVDTHAPVHVVALGGNASGAVDVLRGLADQTRGQYTQVFSAASFSIALDRLADRLSAEMMVEYLVPAAASAGDVRVGVKRPGARVLGLGVSR
jgi:hypothetical protein